MNLGESIHGGCLAIICTEEKQDCEKRPDLGAGDLEGTGSRG